MAGKVACQAPLQGIFLHALYPGHGWPAVPESAYAKIRAGAFAHVARLVAVSLDSSFVVRRRCCCPRCGTSVGGGGPETFWTQRLPADLFRSLVDAVCQALCGRRT